MYTKSVQLAEKVYKLVFFFFILVLSLIQAQTLVLEGMMMTTFSCLLLPINQRKRLVIYDQVTLDCIHHLPLLMFSLSVLSEETRETCFKSFV